MGALDTIINGTDVTSFFVGIAMVYDVAFGSGIWKFILWVLFYVVALMKTKHWGMVSGASMLTGVLIRVYGGMPEYTHPFIYFMIVISFAITLYSLFGDEA